METFKNSVWCSSRSWSTNGLQAAMMSENTFHEAVSTLRSVVRTDRSVVLPRETLRRRELWTMGVAGKPSVETLHKWGHAAHDLGSPGN